MSLTVDEGFLTLSPALLWVQHAAVILKLHLEQSLQKKRWGHYQLISAIFVPHFHLERILFSFRSFGVTSALFQQLHSRPQGDSTSPFCLWLLFPVYSSHWLCFPVHSTSQMENQMLGETKGIQCVTHIMCDKQSLTRAQKWLSRSLDLLFPGKKSAESNQTQVCFVI